MIGMPEGWYDDPAPPNPADPTTMRWWDGNTWTTRVRPATRRERTERREQMAEQQMALHQTGMPGTGGAGYQVPVETYEPDPRDFTSDGQALAGWWARVGASLIDRLIEVPLVVVASWHWITQAIEVFRAYVLAVQQAQQNGSLAPDPAVAMRALAGPLTAMTLVAVGVGLVYEAGFLKAFAATPGKMALGLQVRLRDRPGPLSWGTVLGRWVVKNLATVGRPVPVLGGLLGIFSLLDVLWPLWDGRRQALHDKVARTNVVRR